MSVLARHIFIETVEGEVAEITGYCVDYNGWRSITEAGYYFVSNYVISLKGKKIGAITVEDQNGYHYRTIDVRIMWEEEL